MVPNTERALKQGDKSSNKEHSADDLTGVFQLRNAHCRCYYQHHSDVPAKKCQAVL